MGARHDGHQWLVAVRRGGSSLLVHVAFEQGPALTDRTGVHARRRPTQQRAGQGGSSRKMDADVADLDLPRPRIEP